MTHHQDIGRLNRTLLKIARSPLIDSGDAKAAFQFILEEAAHCSNIERVSIWTYGNQKSKIICIDLFEQSTSRHTGGMELKAADFPSYFDCLSRERVLAVDDARTDPSTREFTAVYLDPHGITSMMDVPLRRSGEMIGVLCHEHVGPPRHWTIRDQYFAVVLSEIICRVFTAEDKRLLLDRLAIANRQKDDLLMMVSHELKTPLNVIGGWTDLMRSGELESNHMARGLEVIARNVRAQGRIVDDLLDTSRIILGRLILKKVPMDLLTAVKSSVGSAQMLAEEKNLTIDLRSDDKPVMIYGDQGRIEQIFDNLLSNAIHHTPNGGMISVFINSHGKNVEVRVVDNGEGIDPVLLPTIFDRFTQGDSIQIKDKGGLGLGLAIVRHLTEAHDGKVSVSSSGKNSGASFSVNFPLLEARMELSL